MKMKKLTFIPYNPSTTIDVRKTNKISTPKPSADANNQFLSTGLALKMSKSLLFGLMVLFRRKKVASSSKVSITSNDSACRKFRKKMEDQLKELV